MSKYKNEFGTLNSDRLIVIHKFLDAQKEKGIYELSEHISDFAEQECEDYKISLAVASRLINKLQTPSPTGDRDCEELKERLIAFGKENNEQFKRISELEKGLENAMTRFKNLESEYPEIAIYPSFWKEIEQLLKP